MRWQFVCAPDMSKTYPERDGLRQASPEKCRQAMPLTDLLLRMSSKNAELAAAQHDEDAVAWGVPRDHQAVMEIQAAKKAAASR